MVSVVPYIKGKDGKWVSLYGQNAMTDDLGHYRLVGLNAGEYLVRAQLQMEDRAVDGVIGGSRSSWSSSRFSLDVYPEDVTRKSLAKPLKLDEGEERTGVDVTIPLGKLHPVTGVVVEEKTGRQVNAGMVKLMFPDDKSQANSVRIDPAESTFRFEFVPEGDYLIQVTGARDVVREEVANGVGALPPTHTVETVVRVYGDSEEQALTVQNDVTGVRIVVKEKAAKGK